MKIHIQHFKQCSVRLLRRIQQSENLAVFPRAAKIVVRERKLAVSVVSGIYALPILLCGKSGFVREMECMAGVVVLMAFAMWMKTAQELIINAPRWQRPVTQPDLNNG